MCHVQTRAGAANALGEPLTYRGIAVAKNLCVSRRSLYQRQVRTSAREQIVFVDPARHE